MTLLRKYYDTGIEGGGIPDDIQKLSEKYWDEDVKTNPTINNPFAFSYGFKLGYKHLIPELARLKEENERLRGEVDKCNHPYLECGLSPLVNINGTPCIKCHTCGEENVCNEQLLTPSPTKK